MRISDWSSDLFSSDLKNDGVEVRFVSGDTENYDIVAGADGLHSNVRSLVFGHESQFERYLGSCFAGFTMPNKYDLENGGVNYTVRGKWAGIFAHGQPDPVYGMLVRAERSRVGKEVVSTVIT